MIFIAFVGFSMMSTFANSSQRQDNYPISSNEEETELPVTVRAISESNGTLELLVEANRVVDEVCDYFNGSWMDTGLKIYCTFNGASAECLAYRIVKAACGINGAIKLYIEGNYNGATKKLLTTGADIWKMVMVGNTVEKGVKLVKSGMCVAN